MAEPWFDPNHFGALYGSIAGGACGVLGGALGALTGILAPRGIGRPWILGGYYIALALGSASLIFGLYALAAGQPLHIWLWPFQVGAILLVVFGGLLPVVKARYRQAEERRFEAEALRKG